MSWRSQSGGDGGLTTDQEIVIDLINNGREKYKSATSGVIDASLGSWQKLSLTEDTNITPTGGAGASIRLTLVPGPHLVTWDTNITKFVDGAAPASLGAEHVVVLETADGVSWTLYDVGEVS